MRGGMRRALLLALGCVLLLQPAAAQETTAPRSELSSQLDRDRALVGTIWSAREKRRIGRDELIDALAKSPIVLLGEVHDNADHHRLRASLIGTLASRRKSAQAGARAGEGTPAIVGPAVVFEHIRANQQPLVDAYVSLLRETPEEAAAGLMTQLQWERSGWPPAALFAPLFEEAFRHRLPILGGNTPTELIRKVGRGGLTALADEERNRLGLDVLLESPLQQALVAEIEASHCGLLPESAFLPMALAQQYRDAQLADTLLTALENHGAAILVAGNGHVRADRGVPWRLRQRAPMISVVTVAFIEVDNKQDDPATYVMMGPDGEAAVDYVWLTPRAERPDPCEKMRQGFGKAAPQSQSGAAEKR